MNDSRSRRRFGYDGLARLAERETFLLSCGRARPRRDQRLLVQGVEGQLLPRRSSRGGHAPVLCRASARGRDQQHVLPDAQGRPPRGLGGAGSGRLPLRAEGFAEDHAPQAAEGGLRGGRIFPSRRRDAGRPVGAFAVSAAAEPEEGPSAAGGFPGAASRRGPRGLRVPPCFLVRGGRLRSAARAGSGPLCGGGRGAGHSPGRDRGLGISAAAPPRLWRGRGRRVGGPHPRPALGRDLRVLQARGRRRRAEAGGADAGAIPAAPGAR